MSRSRLCRKQGFSFHRLLHILENTEVFTTSFYQETDDVNDA
jgi:hypothetical protein